MKQTYRPSMTWTLRALLAGLVLAMGPGRALGQDADEFADDAVTEIAGESGDSAAAGLVSENAPESRTEPQEQEGLVDQPPDEDAGETMDEQAAESVDEGTDEPESEAINEPVDEAAERPVDGPAQRSRQRMASRSDDRSMSRSRDGSRGRSEDEGFNMRASGSGEMTPEYLAISRNNIFSRNRRPAPPDNGTPIPPRPQPNPESYYILRGIVRENDTFIAFLQDNHEGGVLQLREGDEVARGKIKSLTLDSLEYEFADQTIKVVFGRDLEGGQGTLDIDTASQWSPQSGYLSSSRRSRDGGGRLESAPAASSTEPLTGDDAELLRRLMERRQQQLGQ